MKITDNFLVNDNGEDVNTDTIPMRWSFILSSTGSMSSKVRLLEPTRPFSIPNMPPKLPPFLVLQRTKKKKRGIFDGFVGID